jgi:23S rRNA maturation mini-RNase III
VWPDSSLHCYFGYFCRADDTERLCQSLDLQQMQQLGESASAEADAAARAVLLQGAIQQLDEREEEEVRQKEAKKREAEAALKVCGVPTA